MEIWSVSISHLSSLLCPSLPTGYRTTSKRAARPAAISVRGCRARGSRAPSVAASERSPSSRVRGCRREEFKLARPWLPARGRRARASACAWPSSLARRASGRRHSPPRPWCRRLPGRSRGRARVTVVVVRPGSPGRGRHLSYDIAVRPSPPAGEPSARWF
jgi:hypothetical protein